MPVQAARRIASIMSKVKELMEILPAGEMRDHVIDAHHKLHEAHKIADAPERERYLRAQAKKNG